MSGFIYPLAAVFIGGIITLLVSKHYYLRTSEDLKKESSNLRKLSNMILRVMEDEGWVELNRDKQGNIQGFVVTLSSSIKAKSGLRANATIEKPKNKNENKSSNQP